LKGKSSARNGEASAPAKKSDRHRGWGIHQNLCPGQSEKEPGGGRPWEGQQPPKLRGWEGERFTTSEIVGKTNATECRWDRTIGRRSDIWMPSGL
jgi:hypothetical protein